jgi:hypothetical protein
MWLNIFMDHSPFNNIAKIIKNFIPNHSGEKYCNCFLNGHILHNGNNVIVKYLMNAFLN